MKNLAKSLIVIAAVATLITIITRLSSFSVMGLGPRALSAFSVILLLFAIALEGLK